MVRPWIVGSNDLEPIGSSVTDGITGRVSDPVTGAGLFNPNSDANAVGVDPITGADAPVGTDVAFSAPIWRGIRAGILNGDFALPPPDTSLPLGDDNPLPYWRWVPDAAGHISATWVDGSVRFTLDGAATSADTAYLESFVRIAASDAGAYTYQPSAYWSAAGGGLVEYQLVAQYVESDASTTVGASDTATATTLQRMRVYPASRGMVPADAVYLRLRIGVGNTDTMGGTEERDLLEVTADAAPIPQPGNWYGVKIRRTADQATATATAESIHFTATDEYDPWGMHDPSSGSETVEVGWDGTGSGWWEIIGSVTFENNVTGIRQVLVEHNGIDGGGTEVTGSRVTIAASPAGNKTRIQTHAFHEVTDGEGDFFALTVYQNSGGALNVEDATMIVRRVSG